MIAGGNGKFLIYLKNNNLPSNLSISQKYNSDVCKKYRLHIESNGCSNISSKESHKNSLPSLSKDTNNLNINYHDRNKLSMKPSSSYGSLNFQSSNSQNSSFNKAGVLAKGSNSIQCKENNLNTYSHIEEKQKNGVITNSNYNKYSESFFSSINSNNKSDFKNQNNSLKNTNYNFPIQNKSTDVIESLSSHANVGWKSFRSFMTSTVSQVNSVFRDIKQNVNTIYDEQINKPDEPIRLYSRNADIKPQTYQNNSNSLVDNKNKKYYGLSSDTYFRNIDSSVSGDNNATNQNLGGNIDAVKNRNVDSNLVGDDIQVSKVTSSFKNDLNIHCVKEDFRNGENIDKHNNESDVENEDGDIDD